MESTTRTDALSTAERVPPPATLRASEERQAFLLTLSDALSPLVDALEIMETASRLLGDHLRADRTTYTEIDGGFGSRIATVRAQHVRRGAPLPERLDYDAQANGWVSAQLRRGEPVVITDTATDARVSEVERAEWVVGHARAIALHSLLKNGHEVATFGVQQTEPREWTPEEVSLIREVAERTWAAGERARVEVALHETQRRLEEALATGRMAYWEWEPATNTTIASATMSELFGLPPGERFESTRQGIALVHAGDRERYRALVEEATARGEGWHGEFRIVRPRDGAVVWVEERATVTRDPISGAAHTTGMLWDISDRKRADAAAEVERAARERDALRVQLTLAEEEERRRLARELHDEAGQHLTALGLGLQALSNVATPGSEIDRRTIELRALANTLALEMHAIAVRLRPRALDDFGLEAALATYVEEWTRHSEIEVDLHARVGTSRLPTAIESAVYRVVQEALTNIARHSGAKHAGVVVERREGHVVAVVEDDGHGFRDPGEQRVESAGLGLLGIRERVALLGGTLDVESTPGSGTTLFVRIPLAGAGGAVTAP